MDWFSSDWHLGHDNIRKICERPFSSVEEMDEVIVSRMLDTMQKGDTLYFLGDLSFSQESAKKALEALRKKEIFFIWIVGNHDHHCNPSSLKDLYNDFQTSIVYKNREENILIHLNHFPMRVWQQSFRNSFHLYGHVHRTSPELNFLEQPPYGKSLNVNVEFHNYYPYSLDEIIEIMKNKPDNEDYKLLLRRKSI